ncbi:MAG: DUF1080 domain-containing protein [Pirellulaceae bacterium]|jgi:hypothetical protein|nr:DUF1080 domain-containing protein [Pirellulaceae bacterium]
MKIKSIGILLGRSLAVVFTISAAMMSSENVANAQEHERPAQSTNQQQALVQDNENERVLFSGDSLANWKSTLFGGDGEIRIENEAIVLGIGDPLTGVTYKGKDLPVNNYEVSLEARRVKGHDFFCCLTFPVDESHCSLVVGGWAGTIVGLSCLDGQDASDNETTREMSFANETWFRIRVRVTPGKIAAWIDDEQIVDADVSNKELSVRNEVRLSRPLGVCNFRTEAEIRNIRLLKIDEGNLLRAPQPNGSR